MGSFDDITEALRYALFALGDYDHHYLVNVRGPKELEAELAAAIQVVPATMVYNNGDFGLTIHLAFDPASKTFGNLMRFLDTVEHTTFDELRWEGIPLYAKNLGRDIEATIEIVEQLLESVFEYSPGIPIQCNVYDEGLVSDDEELHDEE